MLWEKLREAWAFLEQETLDKLIEKMPRLVRGVIKSKGGFFMKKSDKLIPFFGFCISFFSGRGGRNGDI